jgi:hypothetical protein
LYRNHVDLTGMNLLAVHTESAPKPKYDSCLEPGYVFDPHGTMEWRHYAKVPPDRGDDITFKWHFPAGTLRARMSGLELATFLMEHMPAIIGMGLLADHPRVHAEFCRIWHLFQTTPAKSLDQLVPWIQAVDRRVPRKTADAFGLPRVEEDDIIFLDLNIKHIPERIRKVFY